MIFISPAKQISVTIHSGAVYLINLKNKGYDSETPHLYIVINKTPLVDYRIIMCWITTETDIHRTAMSNRNLAARFIRLTKDTYGELIWPSVIDCHTYEARTLEEIISKYKEGKLRIKKTLHADIVNSIRSKLLDSATLDEKIRKILD